MQMTTEEEKFILVQIPQQIDSKNYNNICEVDEKRCVKSFV